MPASNRRAQLHQQLMLATSDVDALSNLIVRLKSAPPVDEARLERTVERWIETNLRAAELREELARLDREERRES